MVRAVPVVVGRCRCPEWRESTVVHGSFMMSTRSVHSRRTVPTQRPANPFALGDFAELTQRAVGRVFVVVLRIRGEGSARVLFVEDERLVEKFAA